MENNTMPLPCLGWMEKGKGEEVEKGSNFLPFPLSLSLSFFPPKLRTKTFLPILRGVRMLSLLNNISDVLIPPSLGGILLESLHQLVSQKMT